LIEEYLSREIPHASQGSTTASLRSASPSKSQKDRGRFSYERFRREIGRVQDDPTDRLAQLSEQMSWLRDAGFDEVDCHFKWLELALMVAVKSG